MKERRVGSVATKVVSMLLTVIMLLGLCPVMLRTHAEATTGEQGFLELKVYPYIGGVKSEKARTVSFMSNIYIQNKQVIPDESVSGFDVEAKYISSTKIAYFSIRSKIRTLILPM